MGTSQILSCIEEKIHELNNDIDVTCFGHKLKGGRSMQAQKPFEYTLNMKTIFQGKLSELKSYYCREDFELALADYDRAPKDAKKFRMRDVYRLCNARDIDAETLIADRSILESIPTRTVIQDKLLQSFYEMYTQSPATSDFMERIVRRLAPEYSSDTIRVAILKKFVVAAGDNFKRFNTNLIWEWAKKQLSKDEAATYQNSSEEEKKALLLSKIDDSIFGYSDVKLSDEEVLKLIIDRIGKYQDDDTLDFEKIELSENTIVILSEMVSEDKDTICDDTMKYLHILYDRIVNSHIEVDAGKYSELIAGIENDFINQLRTINHISKKGKEDTAADLYRQAKRDVLRAKRNVAKKIDIDFELIEMCNNLAAGNFRVNGKTRVHLYYFAFMFDMKMPLDGRECAPERNIVKNLFQDFYNDNLMRLLSSDHTDPKKASLYEKKPTGEGINYKSFVEMIYIYFLCRDDLNMTPGEKIDKAEEIIDECVKRAKEKGQSANENVGVHTDVYRETHVNVLLNKKIDEIADYILEYYRVYYADKKGIARIMVASEENTASDLIDEIMDDLDGAYPDIELFDVRKKSAMPKEIRDDIIFRLDTGFDWKVKTLLEEKYADDKAFLKVVNAIDDRTHISKGRFNKKDRIRMLLLLHILAVYSSDRETLSMFKLQSRLEEKGVISAGNQITNAIKGLTDIGFDVCKKNNGYCLEKRDYNDNILNDIIEKVSERYFTVDSTSELLMTEALVCRLRFDKRVTRSELIAIYFNYYIALISETEGLDTFPDVFEDYAATIDPYLEEARYQPLSEKNIFDMYIVTALYFYLVENNGYM